jgi:hypothetical protein
VVVSVVVGLVLLLVLVVLAVALEVAVEAEQQDQAQQDKVLLAAQILAMVGLAVEADRVLLDSPKRLQHSTVRVVLVVLVHSHVLVDHQFNMLVVGVVLAITPVQMV